MRIAINGLFLIPGQVGGSETYLRGLVDALARIKSGHEYVLFVGPESASSFDLSERGWQVIVSPIGSRTRAARLLLEQTWLPVTARRAQCTVIHSAGYTAPLLPRPRGVVSIFDMNYKRHPEDFSPAERLVYAALIPSAARVTDHVLTLSEAAKQDVVRWTGIAANKVTVVPLAPRAQWPGDPLEDSAHLTALGIRSRFVLSVAASHPHKNLKRLVEAFPIEDQDDKPVILVIVGSRGRARAELEVLARERQDLVLVLGWIPSDALAALYRNAAALAFPSLYEGFGLPILEAMALGTPVVTSNFGAMSEVAGGAAELVDPYDVASIRAALGRVQDPTLRAQLRQRGLARASEFSWERTAIMTHDVYERVARTNA
jgi:glycosyltransferase involved in cell wall biosynthesis